MYFELEQGSVIVIPDTEPGHFTNVTLILSSIGVGLSICSLILLILTACLFKEWRRNYKNQLLIQFMLARFTYTFVRYFFDIRTVFSVCDGNECIIYLDEMTMIYTEIALISWMFVFTRHMHDSLVKVFSAKTPNIWKVIAVTWTIPLLITIIMYGFFLIQDGNDLIIFLLYLAIIKWPVLIGNAVTLIRILKSLTRPNDVTKATTNNPRLVITMNILIFVFCFQQIFLDIYKIIFIVFNLPSYIMIIFHLITMYHCTASVIFWVFGNARTRKLWKHRLRWGGGKPPLIYTSSLSS